MKRPTIDPETEEAERAVLCAILQRNELAARVSLRSGDFVDPIRALIFNAFTELDRAERPIDGATLLDQLNGRGTEGVIQEVNAFRVVGWTADNVDFHVEIVQRKAADRRVRGALRELANDETAEGHELAARAQEVTARLAEGSSAPRLAPAPPTLEEILRSPAFEIPQRTFPTRFARLNAITSGGIKSRQLTCFAAPPGAGKTHLVGNLAVDISEMIPSLIVSTEVDGAESAARIASQGMRCRADDILALRRSPAEAADYVAGLPIRILFLDGAQDAFAEIRAAMKAVHDLVGQWPALFIDYLQGLVEDTAGDAVRMRTTQMANALRRLAQEFDVPVVAASTTGRAYYIPKGETDDPIFFLAAFKESGGIESAAALAMYLDFSKEYDAEGWAPGRLAVCKSRRGQPGFVPARFHGAHGLFEEVSAVEHALGVQRANAALDGRVLEWVRTCTTPPTQDQLARAGVIGGTRAERLAAADRLVAAGRLARQEGIRPTGRGTRRVEVFVALD